ncbi:MAG: hypothetical protein CFE44_00485 [Burkholderiales bacterium PBB4]|nr:MAG: hypothetical protein CFE44_00485 [Burkholderiales bacterium PBB4]
MGSRKLSFDMPAESAVVFDAFHYHHWRHQWDSLVESTAVVCGAPCPYPGALTQRQGNGCLGALSMRTRFVTYAPPRLAAARMEGECFPFERWAASMRHVELAPSGSTLIYTYSLDTRPRWARWWMAPMVDLVFQYQTRKRFRRLQAFLHHHADEIRAWQETRTQPPTCATVANH